MQAQAVDQHRELVFRRKQCEEEYVLLDPVAPVVTPLAHMATAGTVPVTALAAAVAQEARHLTAPVATVPADGCRSRRPTDRRLIHIMYTTMEF